MSSTICLLFTVVAQRHTSEKVQNSTAVRWRFLPVLLSSDSCCRQIIHNTKACMYERTLRRRGSPSSKPWPKELFSHSLCILRSLLQRWICIHLPRAGRQISSLWQHYSTVRRMLLIVLCLNWRCIHREAVFWLSYLSCHP